MVGATDETTEPRLVQVCPFVEPCTTNDGSVIWSAYALGRVRVAPERSNRYTGGPEVIAAVVTRAAATVGRSAQPGPLGCPQ